jgi:uncharacterized membrane protein YgcG
MENLKKILVLVLVPSILVLYFPRIGLSEEASYYAQTDIKKHTPEVLSMPEEEMPTEKVVKPAPKWPWVVLSLLLLGGAVAAFAGGGGGGGGGGGSTSGSSGSVSVGW